MSSLIVGTSFRIVWRNTSIKYTYDWNNGIWNEIWFFHLIFDINLFPLRFISIILLFINWVLYHRPLCIVMEKCNKNQYIIILASSNRKELSKGIVIMFFWSFHQLWMKCNQFLIYRFIFTFPRLVTKFVLEDVFNVAAMKRCIIFFDVM